jgi:hypothetical protein
VPIVNNPRALGGWTFAKLTEIYQIEAGFKVKCKVNSTR